MHKNSRLDLNKRFGNVYSILEEKGEIIKNNRQKSKMAFAEKIGTKGHIIDLYLKGHRHITYEQVKRLCNKYQVDETYMFQGVGKPFTSFEKLSKTNAKLEKALGINFPSNILFTNVEAFASNTEGADFWEDNQNFQIPGLSGDFVAFNINGDSMAPTILNGDMVICQPLSTNHQIEEGEVYAIVSKQSVWVKRVQRDYTKSHEWTHLKLISDNYEEFPPFTIEIEDVRKLLKVKKRLTGLI